MFLKNDFKNALQEYQSTDLAESREMNSFNESG